MDVLRPFPTSTENSTKLSYDNAHVQKIPTKSDATPRPSIAPTYKPHKSSRNNNRTDSLYTDREKDFIHKSTRLSYDNAHIQKIPTKRDATPAPTYKPHKSSRNNNRTDSLYTDREKDFIHKRFQDLFNDTNLLNSDFPWLSSTNVTNDYSSLYEIPLPSKVHFVMTYSSSWKFYLSAPTILSCVLIVLKIFVCCQRIQNKTTDYVSRRRLSEEEGTPSVSDTDPQPQNDTDPPPNTTSTSAIIINPEISTQDNAISDSPPSYLQCAVNNIGTVNKNVDNTFAELPPPYSICIGPFNNTDEITKVHEGYRVEEAQSYTETDIHLNNFDFTDRTNIERNDRTMEPLSRVVETAIDIDDCNNVIANSNKTDDENASS